MTDLLNWPLCYRISFLRDAWRRVAERAGGRPIAIYGAGLHTRTFLPIVLQSADGPTVAFIIDDSPSAPKEIHGLPVRHPDAVRPEAVALVLTSSDTVETTLAARATTWASGRAPVLRLYGEDFNDLQRAHRAKSSGIWGTTLVDRNGHLPMSPDSMVLRLARAPERSASSPLPVPPPEFRAGYHSSDDQAYLRSGAADVAAIRRMIGQHAPDAPPITRLLDWGCSSGRMIRHWNDIAAIDGSEVWGCDICASAINWASENLAPPFRFFQCTTRPTLPLPDGSLDLVYGNSVFTHIRELVDTWLMELRRVLRPGGLLFTTILDEAAWERCRSDANNPIRKRCVDIDFSRPMEDDFVCYGGAFDPVTFWHTRGVKRRWSFAFDVLAMELDAVPYQTGVLLRRRG